MLFDGDSLNEVRDKRSITRLEWEVNIKSIQEEEFPKIWVGSLINCCRPNCEFTTSILEPRVYLSVCFYHVKYAF